MHNYLLQAVEWSNQNFVGPGLQVYGLTTTLASSHYRIAFRAKQLIGSSMTMEIKNQPRLKNIHLNLIFTCNIYVPLPSL